MSSPIRLELESNKHGNSYCIDFELGILEGSCDSTYWGYTGNFILSKEDTYLLYTTMYNYYNNKLEV